VTLGADLDADEPRPSGSGFYIALAAWVPLSLCLMVAAGPTQAQMHVDCGLWGCATNNALPLAVMLVPSTPVTLGLATWALRRAARILRAFPDSEKARSASTARFLAWLAVIGVIVGWAWVFHY
jgi:hypothetical protein